MKFSEQFSTSTSSTSSTSSDIDELALTMDKMQEAIDLVYPPLYYGTDKYIERGVVYLCKETEFNPELLVVHPDDIEEVKSKITSRRLVHIRDEPKEKVAERLLRRVNFTYIKPLTNP